MKYTDAVDGLLNDPPVRRLAWLLTEVERFLKRYVIFSNTHQSIAVSLWVAHTYGLEAFDVTPHLAITSPEKRSGKTRLLEALEVLTFRPWRVIQPSEAVLFRKIAADRPALLLDEVDTIFRDRNRTGAYEPLRALLNAGNRRGVSVPRCVGEGRAQRIEEFPIFCAKALAGIGELPDTVADRSIPVRLARRRRSEPVERFRYRAAERESATLRDGLTQTMAEAVSLLRTRSPEIPPILNDRAGELWEPLLLIADLAAGGWPKRARDAAVALHTDSRFDEGTVGVALLTAIYDVFDTADGGRISTPDLLKTLVERDDGPWAEWWGKQVAGGDTKGPAHRLSRLLRPFGIAPKTIRFPDGSTRKGYDRTDFEGAFASYVPSPSEKIVTSSQPAVDAAKMRDEEVLPRSTSSQVFPALDAGCYDVTISNAHGGDGRDGGVPDAVEVLKDPVIRRAVELFGGVIVEVKGITS